MVILRSTLRNIKQIALEYVMYKRRRCHGCGKKVVKGEGWESYSSYALYCDDCFKKDS